MSDSNALERLLIIPAVSRRRFLGVLGYGGLLAVAGGLSACERHRYVRPAGELDLGTVRELLYSVVHVRSKATMVYRDSDGWRALSARCTYNGCDCTFQEPILLCPCCRSQFDLEGRVLQGSKARIDLPWMKVYYRDGHLYADPANLVDSKTHFTTPEIEDAIRNLRERVKDEGIGDEAKVPEELMGQGSGEPGQMFLEDDSELIQKLQKIK